MGSGSVCAYGELETNFKDNMSFEEARELAIKAIKAGILYDLGSGSNVDFVVLTKQSTQHFRNFEKVGFKMIKKPTPYVFEPKNIRSIKSNS